MTGAVRMATCGLSLLLLAGCAGTQLADARKTTPSGDAFTTALAKNYLERSQLSYNGGSYTASDLWAEKSMTAAAGTAPAPSAVSDWDLPAAKVGEITDARARLLRALDASAKVKSPAAAAKAQVSLDCWMQKQAANTIQADITTCRSGFLNAMDEVDEALASGRVGNSFLLFFDWDRAGMPPEAQAIVRDAAEAIKSSGAEKVLVTGFTDTSGNAKYNLRLSERRAEAVKEELVANGVAPEIITVEGRGEEVLIVPTGPNAREPQNRRVRIELQQPAG
jgi:OOP family OmpA-OmpF porin